LAPGRDGPGRLGSKEGTKPNLTLSDLFGFDDIDFSIGSQQVSRGKKAETLATYFLSQI
jgi:hypothetical protein